MKTFSDFLKEAYENTPKEMPFIENEINEAKNPCVSELTDEHPSAVVNAAIAAFPKVLGEYIKKTYKESGFVFSTQIKNEYENGPGVTHYIQVLSNKVPVKGVISAYWKTMQCSCQLTIHNVYTDARQYNFFELYLCDADKQDAKHFIRLEYDIVNKKIVPARA